MAFLQIMTASQHLGRVEVQVSLGNAADFAAEPAKEVDRGHLRQSPAMARPVERHGEFLVRRRSSGQNVLCIALLRIGSGETRSQNRKTSIQALRAGPAMAMQRGLFTQAGATDGLANQFGATTSVQGLNHFRLGQPLEVVAQLSQPGSTASRRSPINLRLCGCVVRVAMVPITCGLIGSWCETTPFS